jgi:hypothetical protein
VWWLFSIKFVQIRHKISIISGSKLTLFRPSGVFFFLSGPLLSGIGRTPESIAK